MDFEIVLIEGKGLGWVASSSRLIKKGECVLRESPLFTFQPTKDRIQNAILLAEQVEQLSQENQAAFHALSSSPTISDKTDPISAIYESNFFSLDQKEDDETETGIFLLASRLNFSCRPNLNHTWNDSDRVEVFIAVRDIQIGEEMTIYYSYPFATSVERQKIYLKNHGFICSCSVCSLPTAALNTSDVRRSGLAQAISAVGSLALDNPSMSITLVRGILASCKLEGIVVIQGSMCSIAADVCAAFCDFDSSMKWSKLAAASYELEGGKSIESTTSLKYAKDPTTNPIARMGRKALFFGGP